MKTIYAIYHVDPNWQIPTWDGTTCPQILDSTPVTRHRSLATALRRSEGCFPPIWTGRYAILEVSDRGIREARL